MAFDLSSGFGTLTLQPEDNTQGLSEFTLFPNLPIELRLKIISHALPPYQLLEFKASTLIADEDTGLYLVFYIVPPSLPLPPTFGGIIPRAPKNWYIASRCLPLLLVNHEFRDHYLLHFPCSLPTFNLPSYTARGRIRYNAAESIEMTNFHGPVFMEDLVVARRKGWRLQKCFEEIENLVITTKMDLHGWVDVLMAFKKLKTVRAVMWATFSRDVEERVKIQVLRSVEFKLKEVELTLRTQNQDNKDYVVPSFELVEQR